MHTSDQLRSLQGHVNSEHPVSGAPSRVWQGTVTIVNPDGTIDCQPLQGLATKVGVPVPAAYTPTVGDQVILADLNGDPRKPIVLTLWAAA